MKKIVTNLYAVKFGAQGFGAPMAFSNDTEAILMFGAAVNDSTSLIGQTYSEASLFKIGTYNPVLAKLKAMTPTLIKNGVDIKLPEVEKTDFEKEVEKFTEEVTNGK